MTKLPLPDNFRPMLAGAIKQDSDFDKLNYPVIASPKLDGIRTLIHPQHGAVTRSLKPIPNRHTREYINALMSAVPLMSGLDGELMAGRQINWTDDDVFNKTTRAVMSHAGEPKLVYWLFDSFYAPDEPYLIRNGMIPRLILPEIDKLQDSNPDVLFMRVESFQCCNKQEVLDYEKRCLERGFEGVMLRDPNKGYKFGRSAITKTQQHLIKLKRFVGEGDAEDAEATIVGFKELAHNENKSTRDAFGLSERSSSKTGLVAGETLGALVVRAINGTFKGVQFKIGTGFDQSLRASIWENRDYHLGRTITFKYQACGSIDAPRFPVFLRFRGDE